MPPQPGTAESSSITPSIVVVLTTLDDRADAAEFARLLVEERLAACVNVLPVMQSLYRWQGVVETSAERQLIIKTTRAQLAALEVRLKQLHTYEVPEMLVLPVADTTVDYRNWLVGAVQ